MNGKKLTELEPLKNQAISGPMRFRAGSEPACLDQLKGMPLAARPRLPAIL